MPVLWGVLFTTSGQKNKAGRKNKAFAVLIYGITESGIHC